MAPSASPEPRPAAGPRERSRSAGPRPGPPRPACVQPLRFAAIADIQYADIDETRGRRYRETLQETERAVRFFNGFSGGGMDFLLHAGDIIDFHNTQEACAGDGGRETARAVAEVMSRLQQARAPHSVFLIGNHELYNWSRDEMLRGVRWSKGRDSGVLRFCPEGSPEFWHSFSPKEGWRCLVLDPYDVSVYRNGRHPTRAPPFNFDLDQAAVELLCRHNPGIAEFVAQRPGENILMNYWKDLPKDDVACRWAPINGGVGEAQLAWLARELEDAAASGENVVVLTHVLVHPNSVPNGCTLIWNYDEVLALLQSHAGRTVQCVVSGHRHEGGFHTDELGIHYLVLESPLFTRAAGEGAFAVAELDDRGLTLTGFGNKGSPLFPEAPSEGAPVDAPRVRRLPLRAAR